MPGETARYCGMLMKLTIVAAAGAAMLLHSAPARADVTLLLCEPYGRVARFSPTGHVAIYVDRVCAESPTVLRRCQPGETGVVISRYKQVGNADWIAIPLLPYLYAVERAADVPDSADPQAVAALRDAYRKAHLQSLAPDAAGGRAPAGNWVQLVGAAYNRQIVAFRVKTTADEDDELIRTLNARPNRPRFNALFRNCADFVRDAINIYFPKAVRSSAIADLGLTTPKHVAKSLVRFAGQRPELGLRVIVVSQVRGSRPQSGATRGVFESLVKKPMYVVPLAVVQPWIPAAMATGYLVAGRFSPERHAAGVYGPAEVEGWARPAADDAGNEPLAGPESEDEDFDIRADRFRARDR